MTGSREICAGDVRFGLFLSGWLDPAEANPPRRLDAHLSRAAAAETAGFSSVWVGQHFLGAPWPVLDTTAFLGRLCAATKSVELGGIYLLPLAHPVALAEALVSLDHLSGGRLIVGAALGWAPREFAAFGVPMSERVSRFREGLRIMEQLWRSDEPFDFVGRHFELHDVRMLARPVRQQGIPVWVGASSEKAVRRAARLGDTWLASSHTPQEVLADLSSVFQDSLLRAGKDVSRRPLFRHCLVAETDELAVQRFVDAFDSYYRVLGEWGIFSQVVGEGHAQGAGPRLPAGRAIVGSPSAVARQIDEYRALGFDDFVFQVGLPGTAEAWVQESISLLGSEVLPMVQTHAVKEATR
ncbi:luciferase [Intrasporangium chromatireducens Q5-1]|uniref:Luciferase n=1 Tax=Intrasporangium chromatireducens Q5-1 TaxID=584657 RepID=W9GMH9_9MICO|nr:LLM class flavin-dependent oxidoreductase [Intrasporangium chromatireducens]EWT07320.1 luciferase [Intrasporangium chromatireducens Q5-1]